jgi:hypothetical protein
VARPAAVRIEIPAQPLFLPEIAIEDRPAADPLVQLGGGEWKGGSARLARGRHRSGVGDDLGVPSLESTEGEK